jgi:hypothetical protein
MLTGAVASDCVCARERFPPLRKGRSFSTLTDARAADFFGALKNKLLQSKQLRQKSR